MFMDVHVMIFIGFGFLYTFLRAHSWGAVTFNWISGAFAMLQSVLWLGFWKKVWAGDFSEKIEISLEVVCESDFAAAAVLIALGVVLGKVNFQQILFLSSVCVCFYQLNATLLDDVYGHTDVGGSMRIHVFGAAFGIMCSWVYMNPK